MASIQNKKSLAASIAAATLLASVLGACGKTETAATLIAEAKQFQAKGDTKSAVIQLKNAVAKSPDDGEARFALGALYVDLFDPVSAEKELRKAASLGIPAERVMPLLAAALSAQTQYQKLLTETEAASVQGNLDVMGLRGDAYLALNQPAKAKEAYETVLKIYDDNAHALIGMARYSLSQRDLDSARSFTEKAVTDKPKDPEAWLFKGELLRAQGKPEEALAAYDKVIALKPDHRGVWLEKAFVDIGLRRFDVATKDMESARKNAPGSLMVVYAQALLDFSQGKLAAAKDSLLKVMRVAPDHQPSMLLAGAVEAGLGNSQQAEQHLRKYLDKNPHNVYARKLLIGALGKSGQTQEALAALAPLLADGDAKDPELMALAGEVYMQAHDYGKAAGYFEKASALAPEMAKLRTSLAMAKLAQGDTGRAVTELETSAKLDTKSSQAGVLLVLTELRLKHFDKALAAVKTLETAQPADAMVQNLKGGVYLAKEDQANARAAFEKALTIQPTYLPAVTNLAQMSIRENKPDEARARLVAFLEKDKKNVEAMNTLATLAARQNKPEEVTQWLEKANSENPDAVAPALQLASHYLRIGQNEKALVLARKLQVSDPKNVDVLGVLALAHTAAKDYPAALDAYGKMVPLVPKSGTPALRMARVHMLMKNPTAAAEDLKKAVATEPGLVEAQLASAELAMASNKPDAALAIARTLEKQSPADPTGFNLEAGVLQAQGKTAPAVAALEQAYAVSKTAPQMIKLHGALMATGKDKDAAALLAKFQQGKPADPQVMLYLAERDIASKQNKSAIERLEALLKLAPTHAPALNNLAWLYQQQKDPRALKTAEQAYAAAPNSPAVQDTLGYVLIEQGDTKRGLPLLQKAVAGAPQSADMHYHLAVGLAKSGDKPGAKKELDLALANKDFRDQEAAKALMRSL